MRSGIKTARKTGPHVFELGKKNEGSHLLSKKNLKRKLTLFYVGKKESLQIRRKLI